MEDQKRSTNSIIKNLTRLFPNPTNSRNIIILLLFITFILSILFIIIQNYTDDLNSGWLLALTYIDIILIVICFLIHINLIYQNQIEKIGYKSL
ncbi:ORF MSV161 putative Helothis armigera EPV ORF F2 protein, similar to GB:AF019224 [Melanoplus sanguinipes entomopoxvirus]|uniref:ORF MSV161 putative Helothis armigera EPV ORF F2 protein, similar to GB:AF019224 n=1 Tax=Melanoplus sanguinipes entomopoxvirus TaxID=83191 RepID=Q9YVT1_MSEPV|nr:ORF MSV161 putative Helothis armigera EPV ORF F2 protein, similar to GB:AF019224 [Melanoplus sanguinipes entomopoxvirus]AAC97778.1 ORF MSV161 putative Helothis armigera EPV ORF F2 protein, similar to GB:AF019224 [Melanoplus sanguinipes entomopoxvirus 'O']